MRKLIVTLILATTLPLTAQEARPARVIKNADAEEAPKPAPRRSILDRLFNKPTPPPPPPPTPAPPAKVVKRKVTKPKPTKPAPTRIERPFEKPTEPPVEPPTIPPPPPEPPAPVAPTEKPPEPPKTVKGKAVKAVPAKFAKPDFGNLDEVAKYKAAKELALKEPSVIDLKTKADTTIDPEDAKAASLAYNRALFRKIRDIEPSLDAYVDKLEQAVLKRVK